MWGRSSAGIPSPSSATVTTTSRPRRPTQMRTSPSTVCSMAFLTRLENTLSSRRGAAATRGGPRARGGSEGVSLAAVDLEADVDLAAVGDRVESVHHLIQQRADVDLDRLQVDHAGVEAADLQQVLEQVLEPLQLAFQQHGGPLGVRRQSGAG